MNSFLPSTVCSMVTSCMLKPKKTYATLTVRLVREDMRVCWMRLPVTLGGSSSAITGTRVSNNPRA